jgi:hypothetical protein
MYMAIALRQSVEEIDNLRQEKIPGHVISEELNRKGIRQNDYRVTGYIESQGISFNLGLITWDRATYSKLVEIAEKYSLKVKEDWFVGENGDRGFLLESKNGPVCYLEKHGLHIDPKFEKASELLEELGEKLYSAKK